MTPNGDEDLESQNSQWRTIQKNIIPKWKPMSPYAPIHISRYFYV